MEKVLISLTSIPRRFDSSLIEVLNVLKKQHGKFKIILNIPKEYKKWGEAEIPEELLNDKEIILWRPTKDYGPATKLLGALEYISKNQSFKYVLTLDDDFYFEDFEYFDYILEFSKLMPSYALTIHGIKLKYYPFELKNGLEYTNNFCFVDVPSGYRGVLYPVEPLIKDDSIFTFSEKLPKGIFNDDDAYFGMFLNYINVPLFAIPKKPGIKGILARNAGSSGVAEKVEKSREKNVTEIFQYAVQNKLFLNKNNKKLTLYVHIKARCIYMKYKIKYLIKKSKKSFNKILCLTDIARYMNKIIIKVEKELKRFKKKLFYSGKKHKQLEEFQYKLENMPYEIYDKVKRGSADIQMPQIKSIEKTLDKIINDKCSISRFGDGEFSCMNYSRIAYHDPSEDLADRLKEVISSDLPNLLIGLPDCFGSLDCYVPYTRKFWRKYMSKKRQMTYSYLNMNRVYYNAFFNRYYLNFNKTDEHYQRCCTYFKRLKEIWKNRDVILFEGQQARLGVANDLFDGAKSISRIIFCPVKNAFIKYDQILSAFDEVNSDVLILAALGPTATVLAYDLCKKGYQAVDFGYIGEEYECFLRKETPLELKSIGRNSKMKHASNPDDPEYKKQIIRKIV